MAYLCFFVENICDEFCKCFKKMDAGKVACGNTDIRISSLKEAIGEVLTQGSIEPHVARKLRGRFLFARSNLFCWQGAGASRWSSSRTRSCRVTGLLSTAGGSPLSVFTFFGSWYPSAVIAMISSNIVAFIPSHMSTSTNTAPPCLPMRPSHPPVSTSLIQIPLGLLLARPSLSFSCCPDDRSTQDPFLSKVLPSLFQWLGLHKYVCIRDRPRYSLAWR